MPGTCDAIPCSGGRKHYDGKEQARTFEVWFDTRCKMPGPNHPQGMFTSSRRLGGIPKVKVEPWAKMEGDNPYCAL